MVTMLSFHWINVLFMQLVPWKLTWLFPIFMLLKIVVFLKLAGAPFSCINGWQCWDSWVAFVEGDIREEIGWGIECRLLIFIEKFLLGLSQTCKMKSKTYPSFTGSLMWNDYGVMNWYFPLRHEISCFKIWAPYSIWFGFYLWLSVCVYFWFLFFFFLNYVMIGIIFALYQQIGYAQGIIN